MRRVAHELYRRWQDDRRIRAGRVSCQLSRLGGDDVHRRSEWRDYQKDLGPNTEQIATGMVATILMPRGSQQTKRPLPRKNRERIASIIAHEQTTMQSRRQMILCLATRCLLTLNQML